MSAFGFCGRTAASEQDRWRRLGGAGRGVQRSWQHCPLFCRHQPNIGSTRPRRRVYASRPTAAIVAQTHAPTLSAMLGPARRRADLAPVALACLLLASAPAVSSRHHSARGAIVDFSKYTHTRDHARTHDAAAFILTHRPPARVCTWQSRQLRRVSSGGGWRLQAPRPAAGKRAPRARGRRAGARGRASRSGLTHGFEQESPPLVGTCKRGGADGST